MSGRPIPGYHRSPYAYALETDLLDAGVDASGAWVETRDTIVYPGGGGQPPDEGTLGDARVTAVKWTGNAWRHELATPEPPAQNGEVAVAIDWARRFDHMQQHTAQHVLSALAEDRWGWKTTAFHLGADRSDVELDTPALSDAQLATLEEAVMKVVRDDVEVSTHYVSVAEYNALGTRSRGLPEGHEGDVRLVVIGDVDVTACGGTHLGSTAQIESVKLLGTESMRGGTRLHWVAGGRVRSRLGAHEARAEGLRKVLGVGDEQLVAQAEAKLELLRQAERRANWMEGLLAEATAARLALDGAPLLDAHFDGMNAAFLKVVSQRLQDGLGARVALLTADAGGDKAFVLVAGAAAPLDLRAAGQRVAELLEGRGGGAGRVFQGRVGSLARREDAVLALKARLAV
jgi:Ser-tRNA(Ala) deacylase AlaX